RNHARRVGERLGLASSEEARRVGGDAFSTNISFGDLDKLHRVQRALESGRIDNETAVLEVVRILRSAGEPMPEETIWQIEEALGAEHKGNARLSMIAEQRAEHRSLSHGPKGSRGYAPRVLPGRRRRLRISRQPGELRPTTKFDS